MSSGGKFIAGIIVLGLIVWVGFSLVNTPEAGKIVKVGFMGPLTGDVASYGESIRRAVEFAQKEFRTDMIELVYEDSHCDEKDAVNAINKLINIDGVVAIIGEVCSEATLAIAPIAEKAGVVLMSPASTNPSISKAGEYIFRTIPSDALQGDFGAKLVAQKRFKKLAILYSNEEYGLGFNNVLIKSFEEAGGEVVASEVFDRGATDLRTQLNNIKNAKADALYIISNSPDSTIAALKQVKELKLELALFGSEGLKNQDILEAAKEEAEGLVVTSVSGGTSSFVKRLEREYGKAPGPFAAQGYDAFLALASVIHSGAHSGSEIKDGLNTITFEGASGMVKFDEAGDVAGNYDVFVVQNGKFVFASQETDAMPKNLEQGEGEKDNDVMEKEN
ncbi:MAG: hypothetical protein COU08_03770 [Candidatus Harrisonbacteria bacterium CG10_big_fil_rev_8_21_14_0_10_42_17]|uniref:Leucine-binding protein domain-containing protein n=1 Tax=Candidatus Harrisonbacteria bacterium CG10_big_fil_rev_8_21_14_0_10_42_17 TaxID=1974584 RepID=A0A2M6WHB1_9BACT|nr:MAG: hypothetical protein COU08_03770 [Candidatus Harrisonbacteria bacterium CG10_big_fil_rev_8_21_14_0_10_42_17]